MLRTRTARTAIPLALSLLVLQAPFAARAQGSPPAAPPAVQTQPPPPPDKPTTTAGQTTQPRADDRRLEKIRRTVGKVGVGGKITLFLANGDELHGALSRVGADDLDLAETDLRQLIAIRYENIKKVRSGYDHFSPLTGRRTSSPRGVKVALYAGLVGLLALPLVVLASMDK
jgi:hypothetical protein